MNHLPHNRDAWDRKVERGCRWTVPVTPEQIAAARAGRIDLILTPTKPVPKKWIPDVRGRDVLCLASGGGQQGPLLAAAGANVTVVDLSPKQLAQDRLVAEREGLTLTTIECDMTHLGQLADQAFDLIVHPCSNCFVPDVRPVWRECHRVLRPGGVLLAGFVNPVLYIFDDALAEQGKLEVRHPLPYSDLESLTDDERQRYIDRGDALCFSHTLETLIGGQLEAGFALTGLMEDIGPEMPLSRYCPTFLATRAARR
jgi:SAM-dependent methyltransferase